MLVVRVEEVDSPDLRRAKRPGTGRGAIMLALTRSFLPEEVSLLMNVKSRLWKQT